MPRSRPPYLIQRFGRQGETLWYYWKRPNQQIRIRAAYGTREFWEEYQRAASGRQKDPQRQRHSTASLAWLIEQYRGSSNWQELAEGTRQVRDRIFHRIVRANPSLPFADVDRPLIVQTRDGYKDTPSIANTFLGAFSGLCKWAVTAGYLTVDPTDGVKLMRKPKTDGFRQWTQEDLVSFRARWPIGTRERLAFEILLNTGLRRGDASRLSKQHLRQGRLQITTEKTGSLINIPVTEELRTVIDNSPTGDLALIPSQHTGQPMKKLSFGNWFRKAAEAANIEGSCHGLRKAAASRLAEAGATVPELNAVFGWRGSAMAMHYIEKASRKKLADNAAAKLGKLERQ